MSEQTTYAADGDSEAMRIASETARKTFGFFWRELSWEYRRIIPGLGLSAVKLAFANAAATGDEPTCEHMWISEIQFDGDTVSGVLLNDPQWIETIKAGDPVSVPLAEISDWMYSQQGKAYGGYTVDVMRAQMSTSERRQHDAAWGLDFGRPGEVQCVPSSAKEAKGFLSGLFSRKNATPPVETPESQEHPMSENMAEKIEAAFREDPALAAQLDGEGWSMLQREALAGNYTPVAIMLRHGADPKARNPKGQSAADLARKMGWTRIVQLLESQP